MSKYKERKNKRRKTMEEMRMKELSRKYCMTLDIVKGEEVVRVNHNMSKLKKDQKGFVEIKEAKPQIIAFLKEAKRRKIKTVRNTSNRRDEGSYRTRY